MAHRGVHFAIDQPTIARLLEAVGNDEALMLVIEQIEESWDEKYVAESDKAWNAIHRCLTDGQLFYENGEYPLNRCICGGKQLHAGDDYTVSYVAPEEVKDVAAALLPITPDWFRERYANVLPEDYAPEYGQEDLEYTWSWFQNVRQVFARAAADGRAMIFTVDA